MRNNKIQSAIAGLLDMFRTGEIPEKIAIATNPKFDVPSSKWSLNNRLIQLVHGTFDSRGIRQWRQAERRVKKGAKAIYILAPKEYQNYRCRCGTVLFSKDLEADRCKQCSKEINQDEISRSIYFNGIPVFRAEDTEGKELPYENIPIPKHSSNLVSARDITIEQIQGRYRLNLTDNKLRIQEFFFDIEWSSFTEDGKKIKLITKEIVDSYFPRLKKAAKKLLFILFKYIPKDYLYFRVSGSGLHIIFFLKGLKDMSEWELITRFLIFKSKLSNTKNADKLVFGLDKDTILSSDRKIAEFGS